MTTNLTTTPGYVVPSHTTPLPRQLNLAQFLQTVLVGVSGLPGPMVRPEWQVAPPKQPDIGVDWLGFGVTLSNPDLYSYVGVDAAGVTHSQRQETVEISLTIYGPNSLDIYSLMRDGFQIQQNLYTLRDAKMGFTEMTQALAVPDLVNERWINRYQSSILLRREINRIYSVPTLISAHGVIHSVVGNEQYLLDWETQN